MKKHLFPLIFLLILALVVPGCTPKAAPEAALPESAYPAGANARTPYPARAPTTQAASDTPTAAAPAPIPLFTIQMFPDGQGWAANWNQTALYHTADSGLNWADVSPADAVSGASGGFSSFFLDGNTAWLSLPLFENSSLLHTSNAGATWSSVSLEFPAGNPQFLDSQNGFLLSRLGAAAGSEFVAVYQSADGGLSWEQRFSHEAGAEEPSLPSGGQKSGFVFPDLINGWVSGSEPVNDFIYLFRSTDSGVNWLLQVVSPPDDTIGAMFESLPPVFFGASEAVLPLRAYLPAGDTRTMFYRSSDGGETWTLLASALPPATRFVFADRENWWLLGESTLFRTRDGGLSWEDLSAALPAGFSPLNLDFTDANSGWMLVSPAGDLSQESNFLYRSSDGGASWELLPAALTP